MRQSRLTLGLAAVLLGCASSSNHAPVSHEGRSGQDEFSYNHQDLDNAIAGLDNHALLRESRGNYEGNQVRAVIYGAKWDNKQEIHAIEIVNPLNGNRVYAATPIGEDGPFVISSDSSREFSYNSFELSKIYSSVISKKD